MVKARKYVVKRRFNGLPTKDDFELVETELPPIKNGELLVKTEWISVDPYQRALNATKPTVPYDQIGYQVGLVLESKDPRYPVGTKVVSHSGWNDYCIIDTSYVEPIWGGVYKMPDLKGLPESLAIGAVGMPGASGYFPFLEICQPKAGETVVVSGAAGAVGSLVGQIGKLKGCKVIGITGSDDKAKWLEEELGFDKTINYKKGDIAAALKEAAPEGVDCYFDNVGGEISSQVILQMNMRGRVAVLGSVSSYNSDPKNPPKATIFQIALVANLIKMEGFAFASKENWHDAFPVFVDWIKSGKLKAKEHITDGFENAVDAFIDMLNGKNYGKAVVRV